LLDCITAAEAMLSGDGTSELTFRLSFRTAGMLGRTAEERKMIFRAMKFFYDARSKTVHGAALSNKQRNTLARVEEAREIIRRLLRAFVRMAEISSASYDAKFTTELLDYILQDELARRRMMKELGVIS
jgi:Apea-like HEPN